MTRWLGRLRKEPWQELGLGEDLSPVALAKAAVPDEARVQRASAETAEPGASDEVRETGGRRRSGESFSSTSRTRPAP